jgi:hypothetical protein
MPWVRPLVVRWEKHKLMHNVEEKMLKTIENDEIIKQTKS